MKISFHDILPRTNQVQEYVMKRTLLSSNLDCLQSQDVHRLISEQVSHLLSNVMEGYSCDRQVVSDMVIKASVTGRAIEGTCNSLENAPSGMTVRAYLNKRFCGRELISFLRDKPYETLIACPIRGKQAGTRSLCHGRGSYFTDYTFNSNKPEAYTTALAVIRTYEKQAGKRHAVWLLYVLINVKTRNPQAIHAQYRSRFGIETGYRCMRQTHAMTTSRNPALRFFLLGVAFLITNLWSALRWRYCQRPRQGGRIVEDTAYELQRHCQFLNQFINDLYVPISCIYTQVAPLDP